MPRTRSTGDEVRNGANVGAKLFPIPSSAMQFDAQGKGFLPNVARTCFDEAPGLDDDHWPTRADQRWAEDVRRFYAARPYGS